MMKRLFPLICVASMLALVGLPSATALALLDDSCPVKVAKGAQTASCSFSCADGDAIFVSASATNGAVSISASCGGASVSCTATPGNPCSDRATATAGGQGACQMVGAAGGGDDDSGTGSCGSDSPPAPPPPPPCALKVAGICILEGTGNPCLDEDLRRIFEGSNDEATTECQVET